MPADAPPCSRARDTQWDRLETRIYLSGRPCEAIGRLTQRVKEVGVCFFASDAKSSARKSWVSPATQSLMEVSWQLNGELKEARHVLRGVWIRTILVCWRSAADGKHNGTRNATTAKVSTARHATGQAAIHEASVLKQPRTAQLPKREALLRAREVHWCSIVGDADGAAERGDLADTDGQVERFGVSRPGSFLAPRRKMAPSQRTQRRSRNIGASILLTSSSDVCCRICWSLLLLLLLLPPSPVPKTYSRREGY